MDYGLLFVTLLRNAFCACCFAKQLNTFINPINDNRYEKADVDNSGGVDVDDLNIIINIMLGKA